MRQRWIAVTTWILFQAVTHAQTNDRPVGMILAARDSRIVSRGRPEIAAADGDLLFSGDRLLTRKQSADFIVCFEKKPAARQSLAPESQITLDRDRVQGPARNLGNAAGDPGLCRLPEVAAEPEIGSKGIGDLSSKVADPAAYQQRVAGIRDDAARQELARIDAALLANPKDMVAMTARAAMLEKTSLAAEAADQYAAIAATWPRQPWAKMLVHDNRRRAAEPQGSGTTYAVVIGVSSYENKTIPALKFAHLDANRFAEYLSQERGNNIPAANIKLLVNPDATRDRINESIRFITEKAGKNDTVLFFMSAHGDVSEKGAYLITYNAQPQNLKDSAYSMESLADLMYTTRARVGRFTMFVDACHAGTIGEIKEKNSVTQKVATSLKDTNNVLALLASKADEIAYEHANFGVGEGHSAFSYFLLRGLAADGVHEADYDNDGRVSLGELSQYVTDSVIKATWRTQHPFDASTMRDTETVLLADLSRKGIQLPRWDPVPKGAFKSKSLDTPGSPYIPQPYPVPPDEAGLEQLIRAEEQGQEVMLKYLEGDEIPQVRADFEFGRDRYREARALAPGSLYLESREEFFEGRLLIFDKKYDEAIAHLETAIRLNPKSPSPYNALGIAYLEMGRYSEAAAAFEAAIARSWYWPYPRHNLALAYMEMGRYEPAIFAYRKAMELAPEYSYLPYNLGLVFYKMNRRREAEDAYLEAKRLADERARKAPSAVRAEAYAERSAMPLIALGLLKAHDGRPVEAAKDYNDALAFLSPYPGNRNIPVARHNLALLLARKKETWAEAERLLTMNLNAGYLPSRQRMAEWLVERGETAEAVVHFQALLAAKPEYTAARLKLAEQLEKLGDAANERCQLEEGRQMDPLNVKVLIALARFENGQNASAAAREAYQAALQNAVDPKLRRSIQAALKKLP